jgi:hypothetical protein
MKIPTKQDLNPFLKYPDSIDDLLVDIPKHCGNFWQRTKGVNKV